MSATESFDEHRLSMASEDYLEAMYRLTIADGDNPMGIRSVDVAEQLNVSKASVNKAINTLKEAGCVEQTRYGRIVLTDYGREYGSEVWRTHKVLRAFLIKDLDVNPEVANEEACLMEHALSRDTIRRWLAFLENQGFSIDDEDDEQFVGNVTVKPVFDTTPKHPKKQGADTRSTDEKPASSSTTDEKPVTA